MNNTEELGKTVPSEKRIRVKLTFSQRDLLLGKHQGNIPLAPLVDEETFRAALVKDSGVVVPLTLGQIEHLLGFLAMEANHTENPRLATRIDRLYEELENLFHRHK